jgi:hypothetical protein
MPPASCAKAVSCPVPNEVVPTKTVAVPSVSTSTRANSFVGNPVIST